MADVGSCRFGEVPNIVHTLIRPKGNALYLETSVKTTKTVVDYVKLKLFFDTVHRFQLLHGQP